MNEHDAFALIDEYVLGTLGPADAQRVADHLADCAPCRAEYNAVRDVFDVVPHALPAEPPSAAMRDRLLARIEPPPAAVPQRWWSHAPRLTAALAAALVVAAAGDVYLVRLLTTRSNPLLPPQAAAPEPSASALVAALSTGHVYGVDGRVGGEAWHLTILQPPAGANAVIFTQVPNAPRGETYRTWVVRAGRVFDAGELPAGTRTRLEMPMPLAAGDIVAFSREAVGSGHRPTTPFLMEVKITG
jgi:hypothetical protein